MQNKRQLIYFRNYYWDFYNAQTEKVKDKIDYVLFLVTVADRIPKKFFDQMKSQKTPKEEIEQALRIKEEYFEYKMKGNKK